MTPEVLVNGQFRDSLSVLDRGLHYGDGVFETIKAVDGRAIRLEQHLQRLCWGCERLRIPQPSLTTLKEEVDRMVRDTMGAVLKIVVTRGPGGRGYGLPEQANPTRILIRYSLPSFPPENYRQGVTVALCDTRLSRNASLAGIKHLNRLEQILARSEWQGSTPAEGLMMDDQGFIIEGTMSNLFLVSRQRLMTTDVSQCGVAGIMRQHVLDTAQDLGISIDITQVNQNLLFDASEVFLTNSLIGIWPVQRIVPVADMGRPLANYTIGSITGKLMQAVARDNPSGQEI